MKSKKHLKIKKKNFKSNYLHNELVYNNINIEKKKDLSRRNLN